MPSLLAQMALAMTLSAVVLGGKVRAEAVSILGAASIFAPSSGILQARAERTVGRVGSSLFAGRDGGGLFAPRAARETAAAPLPQPRALTGTRIEMLRQLIGHAESRRHGYDAVQHGARIKPTKRPTRMTIGEIYAWIDATPRQPHAIGKFQFIPKTLRSLVDRVGVPETVLFSPELQDRLADELLADAGLQAVKTGRIGRHRFMENLAKIWAGLPTSSGKSYYHGYAGNKASMTWADYDARMAVLFPG